MNSKVKTIELNRGKVNAFDLELCHQLLGELEDFEKSKCSALVLTGAGSAFSAGVDLKRVLDDGVKYIDEFLPALSNVFLKVFQSRKPIVAAINGHAIAGGCVLACACDYRVMVDENAKIGFSELSVGLPFPTTAFEIVRHVAPKEFFQELTLFASTYHPSEAQKRGLVHQLINSSRLQERAQEVAMKLGQIPSVSYAHTKMQTIRPAMDRIEKYQDSWDKEMMTYWKSKELNESVRSFLDRLASPKK